MLCFEPTANGQRPTANGQRWLEHRNMLLARSDMMKSRWILGLLLTAVYGCEPPSIRNTFHDCVLDRLSGTADEETLNIVRRACADKFQEEMPIPALANVSGGARFSNSPNLGFAFFSGHLDNRNTDWIVTEVEVQVIPPGSSLGKSYRFSTFMEPFRRIDFSEQISVTKGASDTDSATEFSWRIVKLWGIPVR